MNHEPHVHKSVMDAIRKGSVHMRPRWHFVLLTALSVIGALIVLLVLLYTASLVLFFMKQSGALYLSGFGSRGWWDLLRSLPFSILLLLLVFVTLLEVLVRRFAFVYKKPLLTSVLGITVVVVGGGYLVAQTPLHGELVSLARRGHLPPLVDALYKPPFTMRPDDVYRGTLVGITPAGLILYDMRDGTTTIRITPHTRLPVGADFEEGDSLVVICDESSDGTLEAFGIMEVAPEAGMGQ